jgi:two-component system KDP operon response regulator KdpE
VLSAVGDEGEKVRALNAGADDYVTKPFNPGELIARLNAVLRRVGTTAADPIIAIDDLEIDLAAHQVRQAGESVHLTKTEFELLRVLAVNRGRLMTHRALLLEVWGPGYEHDKQVLRVHMANLRRKVDRGGHERLIRTDPGVGYRLE